MTLKRRDFVKCGLAAGAFTILGVTPKSGRADGPPRAKRLLIVNAAGGIRAHASLLASTQTVHNPWGVKGQFGHLSLGNIFFHADGLAKISRTSSWPGVLQIPDLAEVAPNFAVLGAVDHAPGAFRQGDHRDDGMRMATGYFLPDKPGLFTVLNKFLGAGASMPPPAPVSWIDGFGNSAFTIAGGAWKPHAPAIVSPNKLPSERVRDGSADVGIPIEGAIDARFRARLRAQNGATIESHLAQKKTLRRYSNLFLDKALHVGKPRFLDVARDGITNRMLLEAMGGGATGAPDFDALRATLGVRLLQFGAPAVGINVGAFDLHSDESDQAPLMYPRFAQVLAGIYFALSKIPSGGGSLLDSTLVVTTSEFARTAKGDPSGYFSGRDGSEHWPSYQPHIVFGAGVKPKTLAPIADDTTPKGTTYSTQALLATIGVALGLPTGELETLWPSGTQLHPETSPLLELWA